ncbi:MAG: efflux RND transporter periplasmic adaptor subunit, partial [Acidobacteria bacterium]|nr:efflux RND transporter periplasmic adaptor subunit [Acidobacteriota bacterium]
AMSQQQVDTQQATVDQLDGATRNDQAQVDSAKLNLSYCHIAAPVSGRIGLRLVDPGNMVHASDTNPLLVITQLQPIAVLFTLPEDQLQTVADHMRHGALDVDAYSRDDQTKLASGKLLTIDNEIDQTTGTGRLKAVFNNKGNELWPNQFVNIHLLLETKKNAVVIPSVALQRGPDGNYVFVAKADKTVEVRPVTIAISQGNVAQITNGLAGNEIVVTDGQDKLQAGSRIEPHFQPARAGANPNAAPRNPAPGGSNVSGDGSGNSSPVHGGPRNPQARPPGTGGQNQGTASQ